MPTHAVAAIHLARLDLRRGDRAGAARSLDALFAAGGESYDALVERARLWIEDGRKDAAVTLLERAVRLSRIGGRRGRCCARLGSRGEPWRRPPS